MRPFLAYLSSVFIIVFVLFAGLNVGGAGHGWNNGFAASIPMSAISAAAVFNALRLNPSPTWSSVTLGLGCALIIWLVLASLESGSSSYLPRVWDRQPDGFIIYIVAMLPWLASNLCVLYLRCRATPPQ